MAQTVAVIGASNDRRKFSNKAIRAYRENGFDVLPVHAGAEVIEGIPSYKSLEEINQPIDFVSIYVPPAVGLKMLPAIAEKKPQEVWINPGSESDELIEAAADLKLRTLVACSITALGVAPEEISDQ
jgi:uncharacterized protein